MFRRFLDGTTAANRREIQTHPKLNPHTRFLAEASCDANVCSLIPTLFSPYKGCPGSLMPLGPPHPTRSSHHRIFIALTSGRISVHASTSDDDNSSNGVVSWRLLSSRGYNSLSRSHRPRSSHRRRSRHKKEFSPSYRHSSPVYLTSPSLSSRTNLLTEIHQPSFSLAEVPRRWAVVKFTNDVQARVEIRSHSSQHTLHVSTEESKFGSLGFSYTPQKRFSARIEGRQSWLGLSRTPLFPTLPKLLSKHFRAQSSSYAEALEISPDGIVSPIVFPADDDQHSVHPKSSQASESTNVPLCMRVNAEYVNKERRWTLHTGVDGERREMSAKLMTRPLRVIPRFQIPVSGSQNRGWVRWTRGEQSFVGEVELGWRDFTFAHVWREKLLRLSRTCPSGSRFTLFFKEKNEFKVDSTLLSKVLKGRFSLAVNTTMANKKHLCSASVSLSNSLGSLSAYAKPDHSYGLAVESNFSTQGQSYHIALKSDNLKSISVRLGLFY